MSEPETEVEEILESIADATGWDDSSKILMLCRFIQNKGLTDEFEDFANEVADEEMAECEDE